VLDPLRSLLRTHLLPRRHTALLVALIAAFFARPLIGHRATGIAAFNIAILAILVIALYSVQVDELVGERDALLRRKRKGMQFAWVLVVPAVAARIAVMVSPHPRILVAGSIIWLVLLSFVTWTQIRSLAKQREVTAETISMAISVYLLLALSWGVLYIVIYEFQPHAFSLGPLPPSAAEQPDDHWQVYAVLFYFSLTTLATVGYGDILPLSLQARYSAVAEGITGQFYLAVLVARLVAIQVGGLSTTRKGELP
jgi:amino acid transporter